jgi:hypothetical protein
VARWLGVITAGTAALLTVGSALAASPPLSKLALRAAQIGPGYALKLRADSHGAKGFVTLDMCGFVFRSEALRTARLQVNYLRTGSPIGFSNEVVTYRDGGAQQALAEVRQAVAHCPRGPVESGIAGVGAMTYRIKQLTSAKGLLAGAIPLQIRVTGTADGRHFDSTQLVIYQARGNVLSGVYGYGPLAATTRLSLHAAQASATNLRQR